MSSIEKAKELFAAIPPDWATIRQMLSEADFTKEELALIAVDATDSCFCEYRDALNPAVEDITVDTMHSSYLVESLRILLDYGLDPNKIIAIPDHHGGFDEYNIMEQVQNPK